jgi:carnitine O-acetyltransferase
MNDESPFFLHADGRNRWMDKSLQLVVCANGRVGMPMEHSGFDGSTFLSMANEVYAETCGDNAHAGVSQFAARVRPEALRWEIAPDVHRAIGQALQNVAALIKPLESYAINFADYGKKFVVTHKLSPDGLVQMAFQLAYFRHSGRFDCTYESVMTKSVRVSILSLVIFFGLLPLFSCYRPSIPLLLRWLTVS